MTLLESRDDNTPLRAAPLSFEYTGVPTRPRLTGRRFFGLLMLVLALCLLGAQLGWASAGLFSNVWQARTEVEYRGNSWTETEDVAVQSRSITGPIAAKYGIEIKQFEEDYTAGLMGGTQILRIEYFDTDPVLAQAIITDIAETYIAEASEREPAANMVLLQTSLGELRAELEASEEALLSISTEPGAPLTVEQQNYQTEIATLRARIGTLELRILDMTLAEQDLEERGLPYYVTRPFVFEEPWFPRPMRLALLGGALGGLLGLVLLGWNIYRPDNA